MNENVIIFNPKNHKFMYNLTKYDCYKLDTGKCSLEENIDDSLLTNTNFFSEYQKEYCQKLYLSIKHHGVINPVSIHKNSCGHYSFTDGQHRVCICKRKNISLPAYITDDESFECYDCYWKKKSVMYWIKSKIKINKTFID